jgi:hypothetical protein
MKYELKSHPATMWIVFNVLGAAQNQENASWQNVE